MKNHITELVFVLDRSGSMSGLESDTIGGFNSLIERQKRIKGKCYVTTVLFDSQHETVHDREELSTIMPMTERDYYVRGCTALLDALGDTINHISNIHKYIRSEDVPEQTTFVIMTDGMENASHRYDGPEVRQMIESKKEKSGWEFLFLAANIDAIETAARMGINDDFAANYHPDKEGTRVAYEAIGKAILSTRMGKPIDADWSEAIDNDFAGRDSQR